MPLTSQQLRSVVAVLLGMAFLGMTAGIWADYRQAQKDIVSLQIRVGVLEAAKTATK